MSEDAGGDEQKRPHAVPPVWDGPSGKVGLTVGAEHAGRAAEKQEGGIFVKGGLDCWAAIGPRAIEKRDLAVWLLL